MQLQKILTTDNAIAPLILRVGLGLALIPHGAQKLFGWFGGYGLQGTAQWMESIGLQPGLLMAALAGGAEFFGGLALLLGLLTRPAAALTAFTMLVAIFSVHWSSGFFLSNGGYEYGFVLLIASLSLLVSGGGRFSLDRRMAGSL
ncbi:MAG TPA: DoxX family protein [Pseudomonas sp.]|nr:DoxX family protein [Pseudomonas sp.]